VDVAVTARARVRVLVAVLVVIPMIVAVPALLHGAIVRSGRRRARAARGRGAALGMITSAP
jgi:hypothetical protein